MGSFAPAGTCHLRIFGVTYTAVLTDIQLKRLNTQLL